jgi:hypothetical protein
MPIFVCAVGMYKLVDQKELMESDGSWGELSVFDLSIFQIPGLPTPSALTDGPAASTAARDPKLPKYLPPFPSATELEDWSFDSTRRSDSDGGSSKEGGGLVNGQLKRVGSMLSGGLNGKAEASPTISTPSKSIPEPLADSTNKRKHHRNGRDLFKAARTIESKTSAEEKDALLKLSAQWKRNEPSRASSSDIMDVDSAPVKRGVTKTDNHGEATPATLIEQALEVVRNSAQTFQPSKTSALPYHVAFKLLQETGQTHALPADTMFSTSYDRMLLDEMLDAALPKLKGFLDGPAVEAAIASQQAAETKRRGSIIMPPPSDPTASTSGTAGSAAASAPVTTITSSQGPSISISMPAKPPTIERRPSETPLLPIRFKEIQPPAPPPTFTPAPTLKTSSSSSLPSSASTNPLPPVTQIQLTPVMKSEKSEHKKSEHKKSEHKKSDHHKSEHKKSDHHHHHKEHKSKEHKKLDHHKEKEHKKSDHHKEKEHKKEHKKDKEHRDKEHREHKEHKEHRKEHKELKEYKEHKESKSDHKKLEHKKPEKSAASSRAQSPAPSPLLGHANPSAPSSATSGAPKIKLKLSLTSKASPSPSTPSLPKSKSSSSLSSSLLPSSTSAETPKIPKKKSNNTPTIPLSTSLSQLAATPTPAFLKKGSIPSSLSKSTSAFGSFDMASPMNAGGSSYSSSSLSTTLAFNNYSKEYLAATGDEEEEIRCICTEPTLDDGLFMIACDACGVWFHGRCVQIFDAPEEGWNCLRCLK